MIAVSNVLPHPNPPLIKGRELDFLVSIKPNCVKKRKIPENFFTLASCLAMTTIFNANLLKGGNNMMKITGYHF
jgi:hypothetical protein